jgi:hypothetical protein
MRQRIVAAAITAAAVAVITTSGATGSARTAPKPEKAGWVNLFDGRSLDGWKAADHPEAWTVKDGTLACNGDRSHLFYVGADGQARFENFEAEIEVFTHPGANSGVYFLSQWQDTGWPARGFEMQVNNTQPIFPGDSGDAYRENKKTGSLYGVRNTYKALARDNEWFTLKLRVELPRIQIRVHDTLVVDYVEPEGEVTGLPTPLEKIAPGTFALQCHDRKSQVQYRRIAVRPLPPTPAAQVTRAPNPDPDVAKRYRLARDNFPLVDLRGLDAAKASELETLQAKQRSGEGLYIGVTTTAGKHGEVRSDAGVEAFAKRFAGKPVFVGLRAFEAGWNAGVSAKSLAKVDYVILDGERIVARVPRAEWDTAEGLRSWIVRVTSSALAEEPVDVYGAATFSPGGMGGRFTDAQKQQLIDAAVRNRVAIEINGRLKLPDEPFVRAAKAAGAKFTLGECTLGTPAGDYCFELREKVGLSWRDMWEPGHEPTRGARARPASN